MAEAEGPAESPFKEAPPVDPDKAVKETRKSTTRKRTTKRVSTRSLETEIGAFLVNVNLIILVTPWRGDALDETEIMALARGIDEQAKRSPRFRRMVEYALGAQGMGGLPITVGIIIGRRAARHGIVPPNLGVTPDQLDATLGEFLKVASVGAKPPVMPPTMAGSNDDLP